MNHNYDIKPIDIIEFNEFILSIIHDYISNNKNILLFVAIYIVRKIRNW